MQKPPLAEAQSALGKQKIGSVEIGYLSRCRNSIKKLNMADGRHKNKKLSYRRETYAQRFVSLNILLSHSSSLKVIRNDAVE